MANADKIGHLPESVSEKLVCLSTSHDEQDDDSRQNKKKKKRRSGSLTRMLNFLVNQLTASQFSFFLLFFNFLS